MAEPIVIDVSHWQGNINWQKVGAAGCTAVFIKATNGAFQTDDQYGKNVQGARAAGIKVGSYHFMCASQDPDLQAEKFLATAAINQDLLPALDIEWDIFKGKDRWDALPQKTRVANIGRYVAHIRKALGVYPIIYTATSWWQPNIGAITKYSGTGDAVLFGDCPLWIASYTRYQPKLPAPWPKWNMWQYTSTGEINGIAGHVDMNKLSVSLDSLAMPAR
ncbi:MAG TPA: glycoside hydrolase family 25 protein [Pyrinomonadaceae bacterium]